MSRGPGAGRASRPIGGLAAIAVAAAVWGTTGTATHFAPGVPAFVFGAVTFGLGGLVLAATAGQGTLRAVAQRRTRGWALLGAASLVVYAVAFYAALADAGVALGTTLAIGSSPVFAGLVEWVADRRRVSRRWVVATLVSVVGMVVVTLARSEHDDGGRSLAVGVGSALVAGLTYALYSWAVARGMHAATSRMPLAVSAVVGGTAGGGSTELGGDVGVAAARAARGPNERGLVGAVFGVAAVPLVVLAVAAGGPFLVEAGNWPVFLYLALVPTVVGHSLYAFGLRTATASVATLLSLLEPVVAAVLAVLVVGEHLGLGGWGGIVLVVVGLSVLALPERRAG
ncbi:DMT family transporter [Curtobacterium aurantiacum]|uniref:EamA family transporter n=1 Tax=Curtobacterium aurantiacum TaxID=3236919 RepID=A0ABS5VNA6_9MICO|nr:DMT family transporter [Curtobacterium flaccumfaciens]MBT1546668.1 EamA family transporter [Curtobacterium flaccumfaciens pv. flaccumfaciens]MBT1589532.1 EamA family transporter [Curtobacterium flaccumfaciens pv. flaccumfaciens]